MARIAMLGALSMAGAVAPASAHFPPASDLHPQTVNEQAAMVANARQRRSIVSGYMRLGPREGGVFWPVYEQYEARMDQVDYRYASEISGYDRLGGKLAGDEAAHKLDDLMSTLQARLDIQRWYIMKFRTLLPPATVTRFFEIDDRVHAAFHCGVGSMETPITPAAPQVR